MGGVRGVMIDFAAKKKGAPIWCSRLCTLPQALRHRWKD